jgi:predicted Zn finger-like uncharacterized protein
MDPMIITCESCKTKFRFDPSRFSGRMSKVRCTRCGNIFVVSKPNEEEAFLLPGDFSDETDFDDEKSDPPPSAMPLYRPAGKKSPSRLMVFLFSATLVLLIGSGIFWAAGVIQKSGNLPTKGPDGSEQPILTITETMQAYFLENSKAGQLFVVEGEVLNETAKSVSFVLLEGKLYTSNNNVAQTQKCYSGNTLTRDELKLSSINDIQERMMNREGKNLMNVRILPKNRVPFMLVFHNLPELDALNDYSIEVKSAQLD